MNGWYAAIAFVGAWLIAQIWKTLVGIWSGYKNQQKMSIGSLIDYFTRSGGMPSGHAASMSALTLYFGLAAGFGSEIFILSLATTMIVIYDAIHVRYAVGEQGKALNKILQQNGQKPLPVVEGHTIAQVAVGAILGILVALGVYFCMGT